MKAYLGFALLPLVLIVVYFMNGVVGNHYTMLTMPSVKALKLPAGIELIQPRPHPQIAAVALDAFSGFTQPKPKSMPQTIQPQPLVKHEKKLQLEAVLIDGSRHIAQINGKILSIGDKIQGYHVQSIESNGVVLSGEQGIKMLYMD